MKAIIRIIKKEYITFWGVGGELNYVGLSDGNLKIIIIHTPA